ncbi:MAG: hypothetical protein NVSMB62_21050 [Acidobacteriaceae bacterium]
MQRGIGRQPERILAAAHSAETEHNFAAASREYRRLLELSPNEPTLQAPIFLAMSADAAKAGDPAQSTQYKAITAALDPALAKKANEAGSTTTATRGGNEKADTILAIAAAALQGYTVYRAQKHAQQAQYPSAAEPYAQQTQYPPAPYGQQGYQAPAGNQYVPTPGYGDPTAQPQAYPLQAQQAYPMQQQQYYPPQQPYPQQQPAQQAYPQPQQQPYPQQQSYPPPQSQGYAPPPQHAYPQQQGAYVQGSYPPLKARPMLRRQTTATKQPGKERGRPSKCSTLVRASATLTTLPSPAERF